MPHFILEHANALPTEQDITDAMDIALERGASMDFLGRDNIKVRVTPHSHVLFGDGRTSFLHITAYILDGRSDAQKSELATALLDGLGARFPNIESLTVDVRDMNRVAYKKRLA